MQLSFDQKKELFENGFIKIPGVIPQVMVERARRAINHSLGEGIPKEDIRKFRAQSYCPEVQRTACITDLFHATPVRPLLHSVIDTEHIRPINSGQIALRFPIMSDRAKKAGPHIDGMYSPHNGVPEGTIQNFSALVSVLLSDLPQENAGNFTVWPGTHHQYEQYFREHGPEALLNGMPPIAMPDPHQVTGKAGDVFIAHYLLAHGVTPNVSSNTRYAIFFRIKHNDINESNWQESMKDIWMHWSGMQEDFAQDQRATSAY